MINRELSRLELAFTLPIMSHNGDNFKMRNVDASEKSRRRKISSVGTVERLFGMSGLPVGGFRLYGKLSREQYLQTSKYIPVQYTKVLKERNCRNI